MEHDKQQLGHIRVRRSLYLLTANTRACDAVITCEHLTHTPRRLHNNASADVSALRRRPRTRSA